MVVSEGSPVEGLGKHTPGEGPSPLLSQGVDVAVGLGHGALAILYGPLWVRVSSFWYCSVHFRGGNTCAPRSEALIFLPSKAFFSFCPL